MEKQTYIIWPNDATTKGVTENAIRTIANAGQGNKPVLVEVSLYSPKRSTKQRNSLFGVAYKAIMEQTGLQGTREKDQLHTFMCGEYFGWKETKLRGRIPVRTTTTNEQGERDEIDRGTALDMYAFIQRLAAQCNVQVPDPDPLWHEIKHDGG